MVVLFPIAIAATVLRLHLLGEKSFWLDEGCSYWYATLPWPRFWNLMWLREANMVFYYLLLRAWLHLGNSEAVLRSLSVVFGVATVFAVYRLGRDLFGQSVGLIAAALLAVHSFHIRYSREARSYSLLVFLLVLSTLFFARASSSSGKRSDWAGYVAIGALSVYAHIFALLVLIPHWLALGWRGMRRVGLKTVLFVWSTFAVLIAPMCVFVLVRGGESRLTWIPRPTLTSFLGTMRRLFGYGGGRSVAATAVLGLLFAFLWSIAILMRTSDKSSDAKFPEKLALKLTVLWIVFPIASTLAVSYVKPLFFVRYMVICTPAMVLLAALGAVKLRRLLPTRAWISGLCVALLALLMLDGTRHYFQTIDPDSDWRAVSQFIQKRADPRDAVFIYGSGSEAFGFYERQGLALHKFPAAPAVVFPPELDPGGSRSYKPGKTVQSATRDRERVWLVSPPGRQAVPARDLEQRFRLADTRDFSSEEGTLRVSLYVHTEYDRESQSASR
jgi:mannosyltransferase